VQKERVLIRKIILQSTVDGPGNRAAIFLQGCNLCCAYCHNPETQATTPTDEAAHECRWMTADEVMHEVERAIPFVRGVTVSGGECMLHPQFLTQLFGQCQARGLTCLIDTNGTIDMSQHPTLMQVTDGVMLDVKAWQEETFRKLTGGHNAMVLKNLQYLARKRKLEEVRIVCMAGEVDVEQDIRGIASLTVEHREEIRLKLIRFRPHGVVGRLASSPSPSDEQMQVWEHLARTLFPHVAVT